MALIDRSVKDGIHTVVFRYAAINNWLRWLLVASMGAFIVQPSIATKYGMIACLFAYVVTAVPYWPVLFEVKRRMRDGRITASGSKYSLSNPPTFSWPESSN